VQLLVAPELFLTGYAIGAAAVRRLAEPLDGQSLGAACRIARSEGIALVFGFPERAGDIVYNSAVAISAGGSVLASYRKTHLFGDVDREQFSLYHNDGEEAFTDRAGETGIGQATRLLSRWGLKFFDYDNDGDLDLILANGHPDDMVEQYTANVHYQEPLLLFRHFGGRLIDVSKEAGPAFQKMWSARGLAVGDFDNDGGLDVLISNNGGAPLLLRNRVGRQNNWVGITLIGRRCNVDAIGARVTWSFGGKTRTRMKTGGGSFLSSHDPRMVLGIGQQKKIDWLEVRWPAPSGRLERFVDLPLNRYTTIREATR